MLGSTPSCPSVRGGAAAHGCAAARRAPSGAAPVGADAARGAPRARWMAAPAAAGARCYAPSARTGAATGRGGRVPWCAAALGSLDDLRPAAWCGRSPSGPEASCVRRSAGRWRRDARDHSHPHPSTGYRGQGGDRRQKSPRSSACRNRHNCSSGAAGFRL